ncbi:hypothetical protein LCGC14_1502190 [marine sediment metagenome]|uniref:Uncharacterized protein n=1 Tax=marine sediment metagenome TaxID=412755 RepID=A0A0F9J3V1_9ZZZZ
MFVEFKKGQPLFQAVSLVCLATHKGNSRYPIQNVLSQGEYLVSTDGKRMHIATVPADMLADGQYVVNKCNKTLVQLTLIDGRFPVWEEIIPDNGNSFGVESPFVLGVIGILARQNIAVSPRFVTDLDIDDELIWTVAFEAPAPVLLSTAIDKMEFRAVLMPILFDYEKIIIK